jgi:hypothetical protein
VGQVKIRTVGTGNVPEPLPRGRFGWDIWITLFFIAGLLLASVMVFRSHVAKDQLLLLARGWKFAYGGEWVFLGMPMSGGGFVPGGLTSLLVGLPLLAWPDPRAAALLVMVSHVVAYLLLDRVVGQVLGSSERRVFALFYWLSPWRLFHSAFLWTPNLMVVLGALHFWTIYELRGKPRFWFSVAHVLVLGAAVQIHPSALLLLVVSAVLLFRGFFRINLAGLGLATILTAVSLLPWGAVVFRDPGLLPLRGDRPRRLSQPLLGAVRGVLYWVRYSSLYVSGTIRCLDFSGFVGERAWQAVRPFQYWLLSALGGISLILPTWVNYRFWRRAARRWLVWRKPGGTARVWLEGVVRWTFLAAVVVFLFSPTTIMSWQVLGLLHATVILTVMHLGVLLRSRRQRVARWAVRAYAIASVGLSIAVAFGGPLYRSWGDRCGYLNAMFPPLRSDHRMLDDLDLRDNPQLQVNEPDGWWPYVLEEGSVSERRELEPGERP